MEKQQTSRVVWLRRTTQAGFLLLFFYFFLQTTYHPINRTGGRTTFFFEIDPLVTLTVWLAAHAVASALLLSVVTVVATIFFGRWFCGWICPFGTLHNLFTGIRGGTLKNRLETGSYTSWQKLKYYVLVFFLGGALLGSNLVGWLDPFSFFYRSMATAVFPVVNLGIQRLFGWAYSANPGVGKVRLTSVTEPAYEALRRYFLAVEQPHYFWGLMIGLIFGTVLALNFFRIRFWCRYVCPLGALLGVAGKNPLVRLSTDSAVCNDCRLCLEDCQGGANPSGNGPWKPAECLYCWNCHSICPAGAVTFRFEIPEAGKS